MRCRRRCWREVLLQLEIPWIRALLLIFCGCSFFNAFLIVIRNQTARERTSYGSPANIRFFVSDEAHSSVNWMSEFSCINHSTMLSHQHFPCPVESSPSHAVESPQVSILFLVASKAEHYAKRQAIRRERTQPNLENLSEDAGNSAFAGEQIFVSKTKSTWGSHPHVSVLFLLSANSGTFSFQDNSGDILLIECEEHFSNLTLKTLAGLGFLERTCGRSEQSRHRIKWVAKTDDDVFINVPLLLSFLSTLGEAEPKIYGHLASGKEPFRDTDSKYFIRSEIFSEREFPDYVTGPAYIFPASLVSALLRTAWKEKYLPLEDVLLTGVVAHKLKISRINVPGFTNMDIQPFPTACELKNYVMTVHRVKARKQFAYWRQMQKECVPGDDSNNL
ncbi:unnamed protein product [Cyprideis torosa]|uniref:Hexosyltransferase n=1 Tax=Cyprideis torosa TaxID=163714 RepID=A0A7R8WAM0_9CRUS|nr:unnamed protein product [Cyprideis torosa]CAG0891142.1 unnamed protein product [Cyprideis torosa]